MKINKAIIIEPCQHCNTVHVTLLHLNETGELIDSDRMMNINPLVFEADEEFEEKLKEFLMTHVKRVMESNEVNSVEFMTEKEFEEKKGKTRVH